MQNLGWKFVVVGKIFVLITGCNNLLVEISHFWVLFLLCSWLLLFAILTIHDLIVMAVLVHGFNYGKLTSNLLLQLKLICKQWMLPEFRLRLSKLVYSSDPEINVYNMWRPDEINHWVLSWSVDRLIRL